ncbi:MAG: secondary thiamine-phosphate synthase enzyme YjbQ [Candidatus Methanomethyliaceae archaeon]|nr:secondary thiamine-phosphate synthase enzyme YjbQ [Candidatus Methanomethyliaceae archaeon]MDW7970520.1 secondary thiamine-phosphate synthase enzyme YjbQ [Nitrososphaerota archaeon]
MRVGFKELFLNTKRRREIIDITEEVQKAITENDIENGICLIYSTHSTTAIIINEEESGLMEDILRKIDEDYPKNGIWLHNRIDDNADAHLAGAFIGPSIAIPVKDGRLCLGTWQNIFFLELDGPRIGRRVIIEVLGI